METTRRKAIALLDVATAPPTAVVAVVPAATLETPHEKIRRLAWEISDLLNGLDPSIEQIIIRPSGVGKHAVQTSFEIWNGEA